MRKWIALWSEELIGGAFILIVLCVGGVGLVQYFQGELEERGGCRDYQWVKCKTHVVRTGFLRSGRCHNPWHELRTADGVPLCGCKQRPECAEE